MTEPHVNAEALSPIKRALVEIRELRARVNELEGSAREPIAITGMAVRFPGAQDVDSFAELLWNGVDAITPIPAERWDVGPLFDENPDAPGKMFTRYGGFIERVDSFDAEFFGISPREAASMDPQQRLLLELAWEALEDAGQAPGALTGSRAGVYLGISNNDYGRALFAHPELIDVYFSPGNAYSVAAGRISYFLGAQGPAVSIDTACSSSLVAMHLACAALRGGECDLALAGGVNLILTPEMNINFSKARMMAPDGRCKTFDARADGYVRGEGVAFLVLERLRDARQKTRRVRALVRGSAINQDGRSNGLTAPNGPAQEAVIRAALANAGARPADVDVVEAHGTGTSLGDPIEVQALGNVLREGRDPAQPAMLGSVKTNVGHLEAAAGIAGVVKTVLALERCEVPPHLHFETPNPFIDWASMPVVVPTTRTPWPRRERPRIAGVSSFGFSGTNAHIILEEAPVEDAPAADAPDRPLHLLPIAAKDAEALRELASRHLAGLSDDVDVGAWCHTAATGRSHFAHRVCIRGATAAELRAGLSAFLEGRPHPAVFSGASTSRPKVAFLFTGQGPQHVGMGRALHAGLPVFRRAFDACAAVADPLLPTTLVDLLYGGSDDSPIDDARLAQPALFALEYALATTWRAWGVDPSALIGHSFGEYVAACIAGVMSLDDAMRIVVERTRLVHQLAPEGAMAAIYADENSVSAVLQDAGADVSVATVNGPDHVVISGARARVEQVCRHYEAAGTRVKRLHVSYASHSPLMDAVLAPFAESMARVQFASPQIPVVSNLTGAFADAAVVGRAEYWRDHLRQPVRFAEGMRALHTDGTTHFLEIGPHPVLVGIGAACVPPGYGSWVPSLRRDADAWITLFEAVQVLYAGGCDIDWSELHAAGPRRHAQVPAYPFKRRRHWMDSLGVTQETTRSSRDRWETIERAMDRASTQGPIDLDVSAYPGAWAALEKLTAAHATRVLREARLFLAAGEAHTLDDVMRLAGIGDAYRHLMHRRLRSLAQDGALRADGDAWIADRPLPEADMASHWAEVERSLEQNQELLAYVRNCGTRMSAVLTGRESPLETLFPGGSSELALGLYERSQTMRWVNGLAAAAVDAAADNTPGRKRRVLEVGAGTGGTTSALLSVLPPNRTEYHFTDVSDFFFHEARTRFAAFPFLEFGRFDIDTDVSAQGLAEGTYDLIVSANAVHASRDLRAALRRLLALLSPGGVLVLVESTTHHAWFDMTTGLIEGWQHFNDDLRRDHPLLDAPTWVAALTDAGFLTARAWPGTGSRAEILGQHVLIAMAPGEAAPGLVTRPALAPAQGAADAAMSPTELTIPRASLRQQLEAALPDERMDMLRDIVRDGVVQVLRLDPANAPSRSARLMELGVDSLMAVQLRNLLGSVLELARPLPATIIFDYPTIDAIAGHVETQFVPQKANGGHVAPAADANSSLREAAVAAMSDAEVEQLLLQKLSRV